MSLPSGWELVKLADVAAKQPNALVDGPFGSNLKTTDYVNDGVPVLQGKNITGNKFQWFDVRFISEKKAHSLRRSLVKEGDILIVKIGSIGYSAQIDSLHGYPHAMIPANLCKLTPDLSVIDPTFLVYYLNSNNSVDYLRSNASATSQPALSLGKIKELPVPLPPLTEQKRIASLLARADRIRRLRRTASDLGNSLLQSVFLEMFGDLTVNQKNWDLFFLEDIADVHGGIQVTSTRNSMKLQKPYLRVANVYRNQLVLSEIKMIGLTQSEFERTKLQKDDLLFVEGHGNINEIGRAAVWDGSIEDCVHQNHLICARLDLKLANPIFVSTYVNSPAGKSYFTNISNTTSGLNTISTNTVRSCPIPLPPLSLQEEFAGVVARVESLRGRMSESERQVEGLFESLLAEAFNG